MLRVSRHEETRKTRAAGISPGGSEQPPGLSQAGADP